MFSTGTQYFTSHGESFGFNPLRIFDVRIEIALVFKVFVERLDVKPGAKGCEAECFLAGNNDSVKVAPSRHASSSVDGDGARRSVGENELGEG